MTRFLIATWFIATSVFAADPLDPRRFGGYFDGKSHPIRVNGRLEEADGIALQKAINSIPAIDNTTGGGGAEVLIPGHGLISRPVTLRGSKAVTLQGRNRALLQTVRLVDGKPALSGGFPAILARSRYKAPQPWIPGQLSDTPLVPGPGGSWHVDGGLGWTLDLADSWATGVADPWPGAWQGLTIQCFFKCDAVPQGYGAVWSWTGEPKLGAPHTSTRLLIENTANNDGMKLRVEGVFAGATVQIFTEGVIASGVTYWCAVVYDQAEVRIYLGRPGEQAQIVGRQACGPGKFAPHWSQRLVLGSVPGRWPDGACDVPTFKGVLDGFGISATADFSGQVFAPTGKPTLAQRRLVCNFENMGEGLVRCDTMYGECFLYMRQSGGGVGELALEVRDLMIFSYLGHGILCDDIQQPRFNNVNVNGALTGIELWNNCYEGVMRDITVSSTCFAVKLVGNASVGVLDRGYLVAGHGVGLCGVDAYSMNYSSLYSHSCRVVGWFSGDSPSATFTSCTFGNEQFPHAQEGLVFDHPALMVLTGIGSWYHGNQPAIRVIGGDIVHVTGAVFRGGDDGLPVKADAVRPKKLVLDSCYRIDYPTEPLCDWGGADIRAVE